MISRVKPSERLASRVTFARRLAGFSLLPLFSALSPLVLLPLLARMVSTEVWSSIAVGQSVGGLVAIIASFGWTLIGPTLIARSGSTERRSLYVESLVTRSVVLLAMLPVAAVVVLLITPQGGRVVGVSMAIAISLSGLSASWFNIGAGRAVDVAKYEAIPKLAGTALAAIGLVVFREPAIYPMLIAVSTLLGVLAFTRHVCGAGFWTAARQVAMRDSLRRSSPGAATVVAGGAYSASAVALVGVGASVVSLAAYVSADKVYGMALLAVGSLANALQGWVAEVGGQHGARRRTFAVLAHTVLGVLGCGSLIALGSQVTRMLYGVALEAPQGAMVWMGVAFLCISLNTAVGRLVLIPLGHTRAVLVSTFAGAVVGVPALIAGGVIAGAAGGALGLATSEFVVLLVQIVAVMRARREDCRSQ